MVASKLLNNILMMLTEQIARYRPQSSCYRQILTVFLFIFFYVKLKRKKMSLTVTNYMCKLRLEPMPGVHLPLDFLVESLIYRDFSKKAFRSSQRHLIVPYSQFPGFAGFSLFC